MNLEGVRVLDLTQFLPGPYATQLLADCGADIIRVEDTESGDMVRYLEPQTERNVSGLFDGTNRGKLSIGLDLKSDEGREIFFELATDADVIFEQYRPGVVERLGIGFESVKRHNDSIVYCSLSGYGQDGAYAGRVGHDINYVSLAGMADMTRQDTDSKPTHPGYPVADLAGGLFSAFSILGALLSRELGTTSGEYIDVAMTDVIASFSHPLAYEALTDGDPRPGGTALTGAYPWYDFFECSDGRYVALAALEPRFWKVFCEEVDREDLLEYHLSEEETELAMVRRELETLFQELTRDEWIDELSEEAMIAPVLTPVEALSHPQVEGRIVERSVRAPPRVGYPAESTEQPQSETTIPRHAEHTAEILASIGYDDDTIADLRNRNVVK